jgi:hypothetical protein
LTCANSLEDPAKKAPKTRTAATPFERPRSAPGRSERQTIVDELPDAQSRSRSTGPAPGPATHRPTHDRADLVIACKPIDGPGFDAPTELITSSGAEFDGYSRTWLLPLARALTGDKPGLEVLFEAAVP